jgi:D-3-phosphoglycerate dehydrogenase
MKEFNQMTMNTPRILLVENIHPVAKEILLQEGFVVDLVSNSPSESELIALLKNYDVLGIRSKTEVTDRVIEATAHLLAIGCFCIGTNQVNLLRANRSGVPVFNAPHSNTRSVAELVIAEMISLARQLCDRNTLAHKGEWMKTADGSHEVRGKTLGIIGYGHIGSQLSILAESMGLKVLFYDILKKLPLGNARSVNHLPELLGSSDFVSLHVPETDQTKEMIGPKELELMKQGSYLINASRGTVLNIAAVVQALKSGKLGGTAIDVFPMEPSSNKEKFSSELQGLRNVILTPHIGGSTEEAQFAIGQEVAESFRKYLKFGATTGAVNFPIIEIHKQPKVLRIMNVHRNEPGVLGEINSLVSKLGVNIQAQSLSTDNQIGYMIMDVEVSQGDDLADQIQKLPRSIRTRVMR